MTPTSAPSKLPRATQVAGSEWMRQRVPPGFKWLQSVTEVWGSGAFLGLSFLICEMGGVSSSTARGWGEA